MTEFKYWIYLFLATWPDTNSEYICLQQLDWIWIEYNCDQKIECSYLNIKTYLCYTATSLINFMNIWNLHINLHHLQQIYCICIFTKFLVNAYKRLLSCIFIESFIREKNSLRIAKYYHTTKIFIRIRDLVYSISIKSSLSIGNQQKICLLKLAVLNGLYQILSYIYLQVVQIKLLSSI